MPDTVDHRMSPASELTVRARPGWLHRLVRSALLDLFPTVDNLPGLCAATVDPFLDRLRRGAPTLVWLSLAGSALAYQIAPLITIGLPLPAAWLSAAARDRHADRCSRSGFYPLKQATFLLKTFGGTCWGAQPEVRAQLGHDPLIAAASVEADPALEPA